MAATTAIPVAHITVGEYLGSVYRPDVDYVDGVLEERNVGEFDHGDVQWAVMAAINAFTKEAGIRARPEVRVQVNETRFRIPDVCVVPARWKRTPVIQDPPLLCIEVASPRDTIRDLRHRCGDYLAMGVPEAWILDPLARAVHVVRSNGTVEYRSGSLSIPSLPLFIEVSQIFGVLDFE